MSDTDFIREVDEELRRDQMKGIWDRFGPYIIGVAVLIVAITAGYRGWQAWQESVSQQAGDRYMAAIRLALDGQNEEAENRLTALTADAPGGYPVLARFRAASEMAARGDKAAAIAAFDLIAGDGSVGEIYQNMAKIRSGYLAVDTMDRAAVVARVKPLTSTGNAWRSAAREILGLAAWKAGAYKEAESLFTQISQDTSATQDLRRRSQILLAVTRSQIAPTKKTEPAAANKPAGEKSE